MLNPAGINWCTIWLQYFNILLLIYNVAPLIRWVFFASFESKLDSSLLPAVSIHPYTVRKTGSYCRVNVWKNTIKAWSSHSMQVIKQHPLLRAKFSVEPFAVLFPIIFLEFPFIYNQKFNNFQTNQKTELFRLSFTWNANILLPLSKIEYFTICQSLWVCLHGLSVLCNFFLMYLLVYLAILNEEDRTSLLKYCFAFFLLHYS